VSRLVPAAIAALLLAGCPLPQPLPDYPPGTITPPRILQSTVFPSDPVVLAGTGCAPGDEPSFELTARLFDSNNVEQIVARWFVNYKQGTPTEMPILGDIAIPPNGDPNVLERALPAIPFGPGNAFRPDQYPPFDGVGETRIAELLVSNNFQAEPASPPWRQPATNFEVQVHRWVFVLVPGAVNCGPHPVP
jgi:hypothetical protein